MKKNRRGAILQLRLLERGDSGENFSFIQYTLFMFSLVLVGIVFAMIGFWRVGAVASNERAAYYSSISSTYNVQSGQQAAFFGFTGGSGSVGSVQTTADRITDVRMTTGSTYQHQLNNGNFSFGRWDFVVAGGAAKRVERFYAGPPPCASQDCNE
jgi:hypothetical protein